MSVTLRAPLLRRFFSRKGGTPGSWFLCPRMCFTRQVSFICLTRRARGFPLRVYSSAALSTASSLQPPFLRLRGGRQKQRLTTWRTRTTLDSWPRAAMKYGAGSSHERIPRKEEDAGNRRTAAREDFSSPLFYSPSYASLNVQACVNASGFARGGNSNALGRVCCGAKATKIARWIN